MQQHVQTAPAPADEMAALRERLRELEETLAAIRSGAVDAIIVDGGDGEKVFSLAGAESSYRLMVERMNQGAAMVRAADGLVIFCNLALANIVGAPLERIAGNRLEDFVPEPARPAFRELLRAARFGSVKGELTLHRGNASPVPVLVAVSDMGPSSGLLCVLATDLTEQKRRQAELAAQTVELHRSNRELEDFALVASHDLQEPLRKIRIFAERFQVCNGAQLDEKGRDCLLRMSSAAERMAGLIDALLRYSRIGASGQRIAGVKLGQVVRGVLGDLEVAIRECGATVNVGPLPEIEGDEMQIRQLFQNLLTNALKFRRAGVAPQVSVSCQLLPRDLAQISIEDNGIGFDPQYAGKIFRPFQRLVGPNQYEGIGMGLTICRKIVSRHRGQIEVRSQPDAGSIFVVTLPCRQASGASPAAAESAAHAEVR